MDIITSSTKPNAPVQKILIIDDEEEIRNIIGMTLKTMGYEILEANNGIDGLEAIKKHAPDLILCDVNMPKMDGSTLLGTIKEELDFSGIPFIFLTGNSAKSDMRKGMQLGADDYLTKPFSADELIAVVETRLKKKKSLQKYYEYQFDDIKTNIVQSLPHEFRTPLSSILGFSDILMTEENLPSKDMVEIGGLINKAGLRLHHLLENMALFGQIQLWMHDKEKIQKLQTEIATTLSDIVKTVAQKKMTHYERADAINNSVKNCLVQISSIYLTKIIEELIDNAMKFSEPGTPVTISNDIGDTTVVITIRDEGRGMSQEQIKKIAAFHQFERGQHEQQGAGLGLAISKMLAEIHGGDISIESSEGKGTTVSLRLPKVQQS